MLLVPTPKYLKPQAGVFTGSIDDALVVKDEYLPDEAYLLVISPEKVEITAGSESGLFYAQQTILQLDRQTWQDDGLPCVEIEDEPDFAERGYLLDVSRCKVPTLASLKAFIDLLAYFKFNQFQLYTEHTFPYAGHELVWGDASPITGSEIEELDIYCRERFIELVPNQNSFGHMERWLRYPEYHHLAESPDGFIHPLTGKKVPYGSTLKPNQQSMDFINELYKELLPHFSSSKLHVGCDETWELGHGASRELAEAEGIGALYLRFLKRIAELSERHGKEMLFWADGIINHPELIEALPENIAAVLWGYEAAFPFDDQCRLLADAELPFYVAPGDSSWNSFSGRLSEAEPNISAAARHGLRYGARGMITTHWGDNGHMQTWPIMLPGLICAAASSWNVNEPTPEIDDVIDQFIVEDCSGNFGKAVLALAKLDSSLGLYRRNNSVIFQAFFMTEEEFYKELKPLSVEEITDAFERIEAIRDFISKCDLRSSESNWLIHELELSVDLCHFSLQRMRLLKEGRETRHLASTLKELIGRHELIWLRRNRPGGLWESSGRLRAVLDLI